MAERGNGGSVTFTSASADYDNFTRVGVNVAGDMSGPTGSKDSADNVFRLVHIEGNAASGSATLALALLSTWMGGLLAGRSLQARLRRPGALAAEFRGLRCGRAYGLVAVVAVAVALGVGLGAGGLAVELAMVSVVPLLLQGLAVMHRLALRGGGWRRAPWVVYPLLVLATPQVAPPLALVGLMDNWLDFGNGSPPVGADPR
jgi:hypothetical protein